jgi:hypothetical protein
MLMVNSAWDRELKSTKKIVPDKVQKAYRYVIIPRISKISWPINPYRHFITFVDILMVGNLDANIETLHRLGTQRSNLKSISSWELWCKLRTLVQVESFGASWELWCKLRTLVQVENVGASWELWCKLRIYKF